LKFVNFGEQNGTAVFFSWWLGKAQDWARVSCYYRHDAKAAAYHAELQYNHNAHVHIEIIYSGVARICCKEGQSWKIGLGVLTADFRAGCSSCSMK